MTLDKPHYGMIPVSGSESFFSANSRPYLFATEFPFAALGPELVEGKRVLTIAGSGDVPLHFGAQRAPLVQAVDISRAACRMSFLKFAAARVLPYPDFLWFFLAGIERAASFLHKRGIESLFDRERWLRLHQTLVLSNPRLAQNRWVERVEGGRHPFKVDLRPTELWFLEQISYLARPALFQQTQKGAKAVRLEAAEVTDFLLHQRRAWDLLYLSNVPEYLRSEAVLSERYRCWQASLRRLLQNATAAVSAGGLICWYVYHHPARREQGLEFCQSFLNNIGFAVRRRVITYQCDFPLRSKFTNGLILASTSFFS